MSQLVSTVAQKLKEQKLVEPPVWVSSVKTGSHAERVPQSENFWFDRCASVLVTVSRKTVGVQRLRHKYGGKTSNRVSRSHHRMSGGKSIRLPMQQLEKAGLVKKSKKGREITPAGVALLAKVKAQAG